MNKMVWRKKVAKLKKNARNYIRSKMRNVVNFALADEPDVYDSDEVEVIEAHQETSDRMIEQRKEKKKIFTRDFVKKALTFCITAFIFYKLGKRVRFNALASKEIRAWNSFFDDVITAGSQIIFDHNTNKVYKFTATNIANF